MNILQFVLILGYLALFSFIILKWKWFKDREVIPFVFIFMFLVKVSAGIFAGEMYLKRYEGGDSYVFFKDSQIITESFKQNPVDFIKMVSGLGNDKVFIEKYGPLATWDNTDIVYNDNRTIIRLNAVIGLFSMGFYKIHIIFFAFISMMGLTAIFKAVKLLCDKNAYLLLSVIFLIPGTIFWLSLASKESILIFAMGMMFYHCIRLLTGSKSIGNILGMFLSGFLFIHIKAYLLVLITPCLLAYTWVNVTNNRFALLKYATVYLCLGVLFFNIKYIVNGFDPVNIIFMKRMNFEAFADAFPGGMRSYIALPEIESSWQSIVSSIPVSVTTVFTRPYLWESESLLITFAAIENILLIMIIITGLIYFNVNSFKKNINLILFCITFVVSVYILIGLTTPVMGAIVRYKVPVLPFLCIIPILLSAPPEKKPNTPQIQKAEENDL